jgi:hypothetical protein
VPAPIIEPPVRREGVVVRRRMSSREVRDLIGLVLTVLGALGLVTTAWIWHPLAGMAATSAALVVAGIALGYDW